MTRRLGAAASIAVTCGVLSLLILAAVRVVDWILGGSLYGWIFIIGLMLIIFVAVIVVDVLTDGKATG